MDLVIATVLPCDATGCTVFYCGEPNTPQFVCYSAEVKDRLRIRRGQLVAVDRATAPPEIKWRWFRGEVLELRPAGAVIGARGIAAELRLLEPSLQLAKGDEVWYGRVGGEKEIHDLVRHDQPAHPEELAAATFPLIRAWYAGLDDN
jgi:hypothetical protein